MSWVRADGPAHTTYLVYGLAAIIYLVTALKSPAFFSGGKVESVFVLASVLGVLALAQQLVLTLAGVDLSLPWTMNMGAVLIAYFAHASALQSLGGLAATLGCGLAVGLVNGLGVAVVGISPIIMTLGMNGLVEGLVQVLTNGQGFLTAPSWVRTLGSGSTLTVPNILIAWGVVAIVAVVVLGKTTTGAPLRHGQRSASLPLLRVAGPPDRHRRLCVRRLVGCLRRDPAVRLCRRELPRDG